MRIANDIVLRNISIRFDQEVIFSDFNLTLPKDCATCLMGRSGIGKTTLLRMLAGLIKPASGNIDGLEGEIISMVFQEDRLCPQLNAIQNVLLPIEVTPEKRRKVMALLEKVGLDRDSIIKPAAELSGGMKRRVAIVRSLIYDASIFLLDEPLKELDADTRVGVVECIREMTDGRTLIIATHDPDDIRRFNANRIVL